MTPFVVAGLIPTPVPNTPFFAHAIHGILRFDYATVTFGRRLLFVAEEDARERKACVW